MLIDGVDIADCSSRRCAQDRLRAAGHGPFPRTVRENIAYGRPDATEEEIIAAAKLANADEFITEMPHGYDTMVGERGSRCRAASASASASPAR